MAFTYDPTTDLGRVRLLIGDTDEDTPQFQDSEIAALMAMSGDSVVATASAACLSLATRYSRFADKQVGDMKVSSSQRATQYYKMAEQHQASAIVQGYMVPTAGGVYVADKEAATANSSLVQPSFTTGMMRNT